MLYIPGVDDIPMQAEEAGLPGGNGFVDVTSVLRDGVASMNDDEMIFMSGFELQDAMSAFEIGEPRLDTGFQLPEQRRAPFEPMTPLLPEEVQWHAGHTLAQTVHTLLYVHHLQDLDPDLTPSLSTTEELTRPSELLTVVLRAGLYGLLKCCDLSWRELSAGKLLDGEDWQGEKFEVSLVEGTPVKFVIIKLEEAIQWLSYSYKMMTSSWREPLLLRLSLRKTILELLDCDLYEDPSGFVGLLDHATSLLQALRANPSVKPQPESYANLVLDPLVSRKLVTFVPLRGDELPDADTTWNKIEVWLAGWHEALSLSLVKDISTWEMVGNLQQPNSTIPYIRSYTQSIFNNGVFILNRFNASWLVDKWFSEAVGLSYNTFAASVTRRWKPIVAPSFQALERGLSKLLLAHIISHWYNPPRRRRHFMSDLYRWHELYCTVIELMSNIDRQANEQTGDELVDLIPDAISSWIFSVTREMILSGFQLELFAKNEISFSYWYLAQVLDAHLECLDRLLACSKIGSEQRKEATFQILFLGALQHMALALFAVTFKLSFTNLRQLYSNFPKRYKWAMEPEYTNLPIPFQVLPKLDLFFSSGTEMMRDKDFSPAAAISHAEDLLRELLAHDNIGGWTSHWRAERAQRVRDLLSACECLHGLPESMKDVQVFEFIRLKWTGAPIAWFPTLSG